MKFIGGRLHWADGTHAAIMRANADAAGAEIVAHADGPLRLDGDETALHWIEESSFTVSPTEVRTLAGSEPVTVASMTEFVRALAVDADHVYFTDATRVLRVPR